MTVTVSATDDAGVASVELLVDGASKGFMTNTGGNTWQLPWDTTSASEGAHSLSARATDTASQSTVSQPVSVIVDNLDDPLDDRDSDGMLDEWERAHGLNPADSSDADDDPDGDGFSNLQEFQAGTDPLDAASAPGAGGGGGGFSCAPGGASRSGVALVMLLPGLLVIAWPWPRRAARSRPDR